MDRVALKAALAHAELKLSVGEGDIEAQRKLIADREIAGFSTTTQRQMLDRLEKEQRDYIERRGILTLELGTDPDLN